MQIPTYRVNEIYPCIQGEGCQTGTPMFLVRLQGCDVGCPWCDTKYTWNFNPPHEPVPLDQLSLQDETYAEVSAAEIAEYLLALRNYYLLRWVLLTGGEPAAYPLSPLVAALHEKGFKVSVETSGTEEGVVRCGADWITVSPKFDMPGGKPVLPSVLRQADELKFVIGKETDFERVVQVVLELNSDGYYPEVCVQPVSLSKKATALCVGYAKQMGWRLSVQVHKVIEEP